MADNVTLHISFYVFALLYIRLTVAFVYLRTITNFVGNYMIVERNESWFSLDNYSLIVIRANL